jgi:hypothetical protein
VRLLALLIALLVATPVSAHFFEPRQEKNLMDGRRACLI